MFTVDVVLIDKDGSVYYFACKRNLCDPTEVQLRTEPQYDGAIIVNVQRHELDARMKDTFSRQYKTIFRADKHLDPFKYCVGLSNESHTKTDLCDIAAHVVDTYVASTSAILIVPNDDNRGRIWQMSLAGKCRPVDFAALFVHECTINRDNDACLLLARPLGVKVHEQNARDRYPFMPIVTKTVDCFPCAFSAAIACIHSS